MPSYGCDRQEAVGILCWVGSQVSQGANEEDFSKTAAGNSSKCGKVTVGQAGQAKTLKLQVVR
jgi:hypothetical protein